MQAQILTLHQGGSCVICSQKSNIIGCIPFVWGIYHVSGLLNPSPTLSAYAASKIMSINELHHKMCFSLNKMGHINHNVLLKMVEERMVTWIEVNLDSKPEYCEICIRAKVD
ncbi:hypothetical protein L208DRAFT_1315830 [Tricholoma matsutake]|nr:hypothetical protein L208DRAFT_1315830 [Tricholoma matsutake 945]